MTYRVSMISPNVPQLLRGVRSEVDHAFDAFARGPVRGADATWQPATDVVEDATGWTLTLDVPGVAPDALEVLTEDRTLTVRGERAATATPDGVRTVAQERRTGPFARQFTLPAAADTERMHARFAHGELVLRIEKVQPAQPRRVTVQIGGEAQVGRSSE